ncbi:class I SAM-dependent methyltransferase [bacterium]|nr:class I SAM-dependent methyltransferase [bacterium]
MDLKKIKSKPDLHDSLHKLGYENGIEVGAYRGAGTEALLLESKLKRIWTIDHWQHPRKSDLSNYEDYLSCINRLFKYGPRCIPLKMEAKEAASVFAANSMCYVYIDAGLEYEDYLNIVRVWWFNIKPGGMIAGRLFDWVITSGQMVETDSSMKAVRCFAEEVSHEYNIVHDRQFSGNAEPENYKGSRSWFMLKK